MENIINSGTFSLIILPILIFLARIVDVTFGTIRIIFVSRGLKWLAPIFGFFEIMIWLFAIGQVFSNMTNITYYVAYAGGFACGNFVGIWIEEKMAIGTMVVRIITKKDGIQLIEFLKTEGFGVTSIEAEGATGKVKIIYTIIKRRDLQQIVGIIKRFNPKAFYSIEEVRSAAEGIFPPEKQGLMGNFTGFSRLMRPGK
ncbi:MAG: hypothetical protein MPEBLZ_00713 [Candidatus Methanoperedens nitroreducens]|uniref:Uncharacterized protein n=1 Tax=Candidatus Methanoperedens nitratireducens TaxID=1392998 RepID=A0A0P8CCM3_9EURY|nr:DUF2179 domain-containing protein [Candidatus Methanoperedens sp. BLZ2]KAB2947140.1 MAG: DUF2179 domain-containing protein [Candidatus Methanoperedens sp.]KPQ44694.1 MAG: hypothetical protein MPEBLZ_00713 [Candidatus Methanoperedens sp. BLZ1]MBZ0176942.1 DUF2179 domain-containing protein [Candidatus Methanoperedens nitroreducens]CAG0948369.1 hypothetical protein METP2_00026 [Methanosarcinales archaeon]MCX9078008.1 DUF2179 domain-containing protein [Candidatus Methanoperedens sp.]